MDPPDHHHDKGGWGQIRILVAKFIRNILVVVHNKFIRVTPNIKEVTVNKQSFFWTKKTVKY